MKTNKTSKEINKSEVIKKMIDTKISLINRVQNGEKLKKVAKDLGVKVVQPI